MEGLEKLPDRSPNKVTRHPRRVGKYWIRWGFQDPSLLRSARASTGLRAEEALQLKAGMTVGDGIHFELGHLKYKEYLTLFLS